MVTCAAGAGPATRVKMRRCIFEIADDSGLIDDGFVGSDWTWEDYFEREEREQHILGWSTGMEHVWSIDVLSLAGRTDRISRGQWQHRSLAGESAPHQL
jgi:hypothetical protein